MESLNRFLQAVVDHWEKKKRLIEARSMGKRHAVATFREELIEALAFCNLAVLHDRGVAFHGSGEVDDFLRSVSAIPAMRELCGTLLYWDILNRFRFVLAQEAAQYFTVWAQEARNEAAAAIPVESATQTVTVEVSRVAAARA